MSKGGFKIFFSLRLLLFVALIGVPLGMPTRAAAPATISFQGRVLNKDRTQAPTGNYPFRFSLYNAQSGGSSVWQESWSGTGLAVRYGLFSVELGSITPLASLDWGNSSYWLGIEFDSDRNGTFDQAFSGRVPLTAAPFALSSQTITGTLPISKGGTGATSASSALNNLLPEQSGQSGKALVTNGTSSSWQVLNGGVTDASYITLGSHTGLSNERTLQGTANQINITDGGSSVTLSTPQDIATDSIVQFGRLGLGQAAGSRRLSLATGTTAADGIGFGSDVDLYRSAAGVLSTNGTLQAGSRLLVGDSATLNSDRSGFIYENAATASSFYGLVSLVINSGSGDSIGILGESYIVNSDAGGNGIGLLGRVIGAANDGSTVSSAMSIYAQNQLGFVPATNSYGAYLDTPTGSAITNNYGLYIADQTTGTTSDYGLVIAGADTQALWVSSGADNTDAANGLAFGSSRDTNLYRSTTSTLKTDGSLVVGGASTDLLGQGDLRYYDSDSSNYVGLQAPATVASNLIWTLPSVDGSPGQCLSTSSGVLSWASCGGGTGAPTTSQYLTLGLDASLSAERVLTGTANQIILTDGGANGNLTLSTPQNIGTTSSPTFANLTDSGLTSGRITYAGTSGILQDTANMAYDSTNGLKLGAGSTSALQLTSTAGTSLGGLLFGTDVNLYRGAANELRTDDLLSFGATKTNTTTDFKTYKADGGVGFIFDTSSTYSTGSLLSIRNNGTPKLALSNSGNLVIAGTITQSGTPADIAENIAVSDSSIEAGDIVTADTLHDATARKATVVDRQVLGVISTEPGILISGATAGRPLALAGRVPVKVKPTADIKRGDLVVASDLPGIGDKAGSVGAASVGLALTDQTHSTVYVQLQPGYYLPDFGNTQTGNALSPQQSGVLDAIHLLADGNLAVASLSVDRLTVGSSLIVNGDLAVAGTAKLGGVALPAAESATSEVPAGTTSVFVSTTKVKSGDRVLLTPVNDGGSTGVSISRGQIVPGQGFWAYLNSAQPAAVKFDWLLIH